jgi:hypothetical protein
MPSPAAAPVDPNPHRARLSLDAVSGDVRNSSLYSVSGLSRRDREDNDAPSLPLAGSEPALSELTLHDTAEASEEELVEEWQRYKQLAAQVEQELRARQSARCVGGGWSPVVVILGEKGISMLGEADAACTNCNTGRSTAK